MKSMFGAGHMRFHPDDIDWREINNSPPVPHPHEDDDHDHNDATAAAAEYRWYSKSSSTVSRGGDRVLAAATGLIDSATTSSEGPAGLIDLARTLGGRSWSKTDKRGRQVNSTATTARSRSRSKCTTSASNGGGGGGDESLLLISGDEKRFKCRTCNKPFQTHQALGGHMASHNKLMMKQKQQNREIAIPKHVCNICDKTFPTGQALGGHKRRHWTPPAVVIDQPSSNNNYINTSAASSSTACPPTCSTAGTQLQLCLAPAGGSLIINEEVEAAASGSKVLDFDLNELPPGFGGDEGMESC